MRRIIDMIKPIYKIAVFGLNYKSLLKASDAVMGRRAIRLNTLQKIVMVKLAGGVVLCRMYDLKKNKWSTPSFSPL